ncbi:polysaccharide deacetylase family protein [Aridibaculum aurantiacum]|uniref:polysaccharide deacetylase family protein n=1 Tax=Aridibaculum aurantiacum TaxID=2810307 RepID=UPI001A9768BD|nr:polysaccharide deacetylase family protein [Aridibaculum aurantiacum]
MASCTKKLQSQQPSSTVVAPDSMRPWNGKQAAVVLTYDDALFVHLSHAIPALDSFGFKGTFYLTDYYGKMQQQLPQWKAAANNGHELANHTMNHPCIGQRPGREFVRPEKDLNYYTVQRMTNEITQLNTLLQQVDGKTKRTFAFPCSDTKIGDTAYINASTDKLVAARAVRAEMPAFDKVQLYNIPSYSVNGDTAEKLQALVDQAIEKKALLVFLFHGVGGEHNLNVSLDVHTQLLQHIKQQEKQLWVAPMIDVAAYVKDHQKKR